MTRDNITTNVIAPSRRNSDRGAGISPVSPSASRPTRRSPVRLEVNVGDGGRRGRSRERQEHHIGHVPSNSALHHPADREQAPSRSRHRREERERDRDRERTRARDLDHVREREMVASPRSPIASQIMPSWSRRASASEARQGLGEGVTPNMRRTTSGEKQQRSPVYARGDEDGEKERKAEDLRRASEQLGQVFGIAAG